jgi:heme-degrading monooxygenase HmoA
MVWQDRQAHPQSIVCANTTVLVMSAPSSSLANTPKPPYYAVIFTSARTEGDDRGYGTMATRMVELAKTMPGFLGVESVRDHAGVGITVSYWRSEQDISVWKNHADHLEAQAAGKSRWYSDYQVRVAKVERAYGK